MPWDQARPRAADYGTPHRKARAAAAKLHDPSDPCTRCGHALGPMGPGLHYDHSPDRTHYLGFAHGDPCTTCGQRCNQRAGAVTGRSRQTATTLRW